MWTHEYQGTVCFWVRCHQSSGTNWVIQTWDDWRWSFFCSHARANVCLSWFVVSSYFFREWANDDEDEDERSKAPQSSNPIDKQFEQFQADQAAQREREEQLRLAEEKRLQHLKQQEEKQKTEQLAAQQRHEQ